MSKKAKIPEIRFRRRPRKESEGWEAFLDGQWRDLSGELPRDLDERLNRMLEDPSERQAAEETYPQGILLDVPPVDDD